MGVDGFDNKMLPFECSFIGSPSILINLTGYVRTWIFAGKDPITVINRGGSSMKDGLDLGTKYHYQISML